MQVSKYVAVHGSNRVIATAIYPANTSQGFSRLGNDCLIVIVSFLVTSVENVFDFSRLPRWSRLQCVCKKLHQVCCSPQITGLLNVRVPSLDVLQYLCHLSGVRHLGFYPPASTDWLRLLPNFKSLQTLNLFYSGDITDKGFKHIALCTTLKSLRLSDLAITDEMFAQFSTLTALEQLKVLAGTDQSLKTVALFTNLQDLDISGRHWFTDDGLRLLSHLKLRRLNVAYTSVSDVGLLALNLENIERLEIHGTQVSDAALSRLGPRLSYLSRSLGFTNNQSAALAKLTSLTELVMYGCTIADIQLLSTLTNLRSLSVTGLGLDLRAVNFPTLQRLCVGGDNASHFDALSRLCHLESLSLQTVGPENVLMNELSLLTRLKELNLATTRINDDAFEKISCLTSLRSLNIAFCTRITDKSVCWIEELKQLETLKCLSSGMTKAKVMERLSHIDYIT